MQVTMGNANPHQNGVPLEHGQPVVYSWGVEDGAYSHRADGRDNGKAVGLRVLQGGMVTHEPDHEAFVSIVNDWPNHSPSPPSWVDSDTPDLAQMLAEFYDCPVGTPADVEDTHHTIHGAPGVGPAAPAPEEG